MMRWAVLKYVRRQFEACPSGCRCIASSALVAAPSAQGVSMLSNRWRALLVMLTAVCSMSAGCPPRTVEDEICKAAKRSSGSDDLKCSAPFGRVSLLSSGRGVSVGDLAKGYLGQPLTRKPGASSLADLLATQFFASSAQPEVSYETSETADVGVNADVQLTKLLPIDLAPTAMVSVGSASKVKYKVKMSGARYIKLQSPAPALSTAIQTPFDDQVLEIARIQVKQWLCTDNRNRHYVDGVLVAKLEAELEFTDSNGVEVGVSVKGLSAATGPAGLSSFMTNKDGVIEAATKTPGLEATGGVKVKFTSTGKLTITTGEDLTIGYTIAPLYEVFGPPDSPLFLNACTDRLPPCRRVPEGKMAEGGEWPFSCMFAPNTTVTLNVRGQVNVTTPALGGDVNGKQVELVVTANDLQSSKLVDVSHEDASKHPQVSVIVPDVHVGNDGRLKGKLTLKTCRWASSKECDLKGLTLSAE